MEKDKIQESAVPTEEAIKVRRYANMLRENGVGWGVEDVGKAIRGLILFAILNDDGNSFIYTGSYSQFFYGDPMNVLGTKFRILERLDFESEAPETPEEIRAEVRVLRERAKETDFFKKEAYEQAGKLWKGFRERVKVLVESRPDLQEAMSYYSEDNHRLHREGRLK